MKKRKKGFTLIELVIVISLVVILNAIAFPSFQRIRQETYANRLANDFRLIRDSIEFALSELGEPPRDGLPGNHPAKLQPYLPEEAMRLSITSAQWDWENWNNRNRDFKYGMTLRMRRGLENDDLMTRVDAIFDDGDLNTGTFIRERHFGGYAIVFD